MPHSKGNISGIKVQGYEGQGQYEIRSKDTHPYCNIKIREIARLLINLRTRNKGAGVNKLII